MGKGREVIAMYMYMGNQNCQRRCKQEEEEAKARMGKRCPS